MLGRETQRLPLRFCEVRIQRGVAVGNPGIVHCILEHEVATQVPEPAHAGAEANESLR